LNTAIEIIRGLPEDEQDIAAAEVMGVLSGFPTHEERLALTNGREAYERGEFVPLDQWRHDMELSAD
jgi:hypothetical protein